VSLACSKREEANLENLAQSNENDPISQTDDDESYTPQFFALNGRIGRLRLIVYLSVAIFPAALLQQFVLRHYPAITQYPNLLVSLYSLSFLLSR